MRKLTLVSKSYRTYQLSGLTLVFDDEIAVNQRLGDECFHSNCNRHLKKAHFCAWSILMTIYSKMVFTVLVVHIH